MTALTGDMHFGRFVRLSLKIGEGGSVRTELSMLEEELTLELTPRTAASGNKGEITRFGSAKEAALAHARAKVRAVGAPRAVSVDAAEGLRLHLSSTNASGYTCVCFALENSASNPYHCKRKRGSEGSNTANPPGTPALAAFPNGGGVLERGLRRHLKAAGAGTASGSLRGPFLPHQGEGGERGSEGGGGRGGRSPCT